MIHDSAETLCSCDFFVITGSEFGIVLLSTVRSLPPAMLPVTRSGEKIEDLGWKRENLGFITDKHQICVGITRCKYGLAIVGRCSQAEMVHRVSLCHNVSQSDYCR